MIPTTDPTAEVLALRDFEAMIAATPGGDFKFFEPAGFAWSEEILDCYPIVRREYDALAGYIKDWPAFQELTPGFAAPITRDDFWKVFAFKGYGVSVPEVLTASCPHTRALVEGVPEMKSAMFSVLYPGKTLARHRGPYKGVLRAHLGLDVPSEDPDLCGIRIFGADGSSETHGWANGKLLVFDDSFEHEAWNLTDRPRAVLFMDLVRPLGDDRLDEANDQIIEAMSRSPVIQNPNLNAQFNVALQIAIQQRASQQ